MIRVNCFRGIQLKRTTQYRIRLLYRTVAVREKIWYDKRGLRMRRCGPDTFPVLFYGCSLRRF